MFGPHRQVVVNLPRGSACFPPKVFLQSHVVMLPEPKAVSGTRKSFVCGAWEQFVWDSASSFQISLLDFRIGPELPYCTRTRL